MHFTQCGQTGVMVLVHWQWQWQWHSDHYCGAPKRSKHFQYYYFCASDASFLQHNAAVLDGMECMLVHCKKSTKTNGEVSKFFFWRLSVHIRHCCAASIVQSEWCIEARTHPQTRPRSNWMKQNKINTRFHWIAIWLKLIGLIRQREIDGIRQFCKLVNYSNILSRFEGNV